MWFTQPHYDSLPTLNLHKGINAQMWILLCHSYPLKAEFILIEMRDHILSLTLAVRVILDPDRWMLSKSLDENLLEWWGNLQNSCSGISIALQALPVMEQASVATIHSPGFDPTADKSYTPCRSFATCACSWSFMLCEMQEPINSYQHIAWNGIKIIVLSKKCTNCGQLDC